MNTPRKKPNSPRKKINKNQFITKSGASIKVNRNLTDKLRARRDSFARRRAERMAGMPKSRLKRFFYRLHPVRLYKYWFSREGAIMALKLVGIGIVTVFLLLVGLFAYFRKDLPNITDISGKNIGGTNRYYDRTGQILLWEDVESVKRIPVADDQISQYIKDASVAVEDKDFFKHGGFDVRGIVRAEFNNVIKHGSTQGGSTITQQLVRLTQTGVGNQQTYTRKIKELILAIELERSYTKQEILTGYLNAAPYGGIDYGVEAASRDYFHKAAKDLTIDEAAMLASIPKSPSVYSPYSEVFDKQGLLDREHYVLDLMAQQGKITIAQRDAAKKVDTIAQVFARPASKYAGIQAPYFVLAAQKELENKYTDTVDKNGWKIITTLDMGLQTKAEQLVAGNVSNVSRLTGGLADEQAMVGEDVQTGQVVMLVGGTDFNNPDHGKINYAHDAFIPPGSSFKPYDYTSFIENNTTVGAGSVLYDSQGPIPGYPCTDHSRPAPKGTGNCLTDYDFLTPGPITLRYALGGSRNIPAVKAMLGTIPNDTSAGRVSSINKVIDTASAMIDNPSEPKAYQCYQQGTDISAPKATDVTQCYGASAIGDGAFLHLDDHVNGLSTLARLGAAIPRTYILKIIDSSGKTFDEFKQPVAKQVVRPDSAYIVDDMASDPNASYLPGSYKFQHQASGWHFAVKTGTTNNGFDGLMTSWSTKYAVVSWVGNHTRNVDITSRTGTAMEYLTEPLTRGWMEAAHANVKPANWVQPADIKVLPAFVVRNHIHYGDVEPSPSTDLFPSWYQAPNKTGGTSTIDSVSNKLATSCTPSLARKDLGNANANSFSVDPFVDNGSASTISNATDDVHVCGEAKPQITLTVSPDPANCNTSCTFTATVTAGAHPLSSDQNKGTINFMIDGQIVQTLTVSDSPSTVSYAYTVAVSGSHTVSAQVIDSVLYDTTDSATVNFTPGAVTSPLTLQAPSISGNTATFSWTGTGTGPYTVTVTGPSPSPTTKTCTSSSGSSCSVTLLPGPGSYQASVTDSSSPSQKSTTITFTK